jgi:hypothetical protein
MRVGIEGKGNRGGKLWAPGDWVAMGDFPQFMKLRQNRIE